MRKLQTSKWFKNYLILFIAFFIIEILFKVCGGISLIDYSLLRIFISSNILAIFLGFIESFFHKVVNIVINIILVLGLSIYTLAQVGFENFLGVYMSFGTSSQLGAVIDYIIEFLASFHWYYWLILIPFVLLVLYYIFLEKKIFKDLPKLKKEFAIKKIIIRCGVFILFLTTLNLAYFSTLKFEFMQNKLQTVSNYELFRNPSIPSIAIKQFGSITFGFLDVKNHFFPVEESELTVNFEKQEQVITDYSRIIDDAAWDSLIAAETNKTYKNLNNYFISKKITSKNEYTGLFKDKNVIVIMMESVGELIINEDYFPNFYKMYNEGLTWTNHYSPRNACATGNNEMSGMVSLYTIYNSCTANNYKKNTYFESIFNVFETRGYTTSSMHNYTEGYYFRNTIHKNMGSDKYYGVQDLGIDYGTVYKEWASDEEFFDVALDILLNDNTDQPFMTWLTTVTPHQPYSVSSTHGDMYLELFKDTGLPKEIQRYYSKLTVFDKALGLLMDRLESAGIMEDTVIVLYGDHYPYGLSKSQLSKELDYDLGDYEAERTPFVIYNSGIKGKKFADYTSYMNIVPTLANLFDLEYDPRLYMGTDLLSEDYQSLVVFADGSWKNEIAYYNASTGKLKHFTDTLYTEDEIKDINDKINLDMKMSTSAIKNNYFNYLEKGLEKYKVEEKEVEKIPEPIE